MLKLKAIKFYLKSLVMENFGNVKVGILKAFDYLL